MGSQRGTPMKSLSPKQRQALEAIPQYLTWRGHGVHPGDRFGMAAIRSILMA